MTDTPSHSFTRIALVGRHEDPRVLQSMQGLAAQLRERGCVPIADIASDLDFGSIDVERLPERDFAANADLIVAVGGDGTMLYAARLATPGAVPLLGVNRGRLGFLADVSPREMRDRLDDVLEGRFVRESRALLRARLMHPEADNPTALALNDVVVQKWETGRMLDFETWIDGEYVNTHGGDGLVIATATGSTAYALSCGGPIIHPELDALVLVPICPHTLSDRPIVVRSTSSVEIRLVERPDTKAQVTCDGILLGDLEPGARLFIGPGEARVTLLHPRAHDYYRILRSKLHWGRGGLNRRSDDD
jgi:NAD+ kinase